MKLYRPTGCWLNALCLCLIQGSENIGMDNDGKKAMKEGKDLFLSDHVF